MIKINATGDTTLHTKGKYCEDDILVKVPSGGSNGGFTTKLNKIQFNGDIDGQAIMFSNIPFETSLDDIVLA